ncbi:alcohol dehydrogenase [Parafrankia colletiae]|uniref:Alcohol dehydrogenase n=1 Tax=Parafrankia colletiae TaxID=573497 RepID=A0A1S1QAB5_9ACTN|nr:aldo/keto reductase [Parafrankia colletiae]MCK9903399.1 aldo/keto reductase [Frankia sp. Cpl3]OHV30032.1 alcohol dehydrogenase [Parafrankia colletiae]
MDYANLGTSGLKVSRIALGCMSFGRPGTGRDWTLDADSATSIFKQAIELGINFWDTANTYGRGSSEEITGDAVKRYTSRDQVVIATKLFAPMGTGPGGRGLSRRAVFEQLDASLRRLGTDWIDLYQIHRFDRLTPVEETMEALHDAVKSGKVRYLGASSMWAWQFSKMQYTAQLHGWTKFISMQDQYNLVAREEEREMFPLLADQGVGSLPWSPLAAGLVTRPWGNVSTARGTLNPTADSSGTPLFLDSDRGTIDAVQRIAESRGVSMAQVAMAWVLRNPVVTAPIVGATKPHHLSDAVAALDLVLSDDEVTALEEHYTPRKPTYYGSESGY